MRLTAEEKLHRLYKLADGKHYTITIDSDYISIRDISGNGIYTDNFTAAKKWLEKNSKKK